MAQTPRADPGLICPLHKKDVSEVCHTCPWWYQIRGVDHNTGDKVDDWRCAVALLPLLSIENAAQTRGVQVATEDMRNNIVKRMDNPSPVPFRKMLE